MRITTSLTLNAQRSLAQTSRVIARSLERLSSGNRVNSPRDDQASFSMQTKLESQVRGLRQAALNINMTQGLLETADSAITSQIEIVQRMRELSVQAANGSLTAADRSNLNKELSQLYSEYNRIVQNTEFNGMNLLNGKVDPFKIQLGANVGDHTQLTLAQTKASQMFTRTAGNGVFTTGQTFTSGGTFYNAIHGQKLADINGDGILDRITSAWGNSTISVAIGNGNGTFGGNVNYAADFQAGEIQVGDIDGDGKMDLVVSDYSTASISFYTGKGDGTFDARRTIAAVAGNQSVELSDVNKDGKLDIIQANINTNDVSVYLNQGSRTFAAGVNYSVYSVNPSQVRGADVNNDGNMDLIVGGGNNALSILLGTGNGTFSTQITSALGNPGFSYDLSVGDVNDDGIVDVAVDYSTGVSIMIGTGTGSFTVGSNITGLTTGAGELLVDVNGDRKLDLLVASSGEIVAYLNNGSGTFTKGRTVGIGYYGFTTGDINGDGALDVISITGSNTGNTFFGNTQTMDASMEVDISTQSSAQYLLTVLDNALTNLNSERSKISALHNRLDRAVSSNLLISDSLDEARSKSKDVDMAMEVAELVRNQIMQQAQVAVLAQANIQLQSVLTLLYPNRSTF